MTEQEFLRQVWRAYDTVELDCGLRRKVLNVCFPTRSVQVSLDKDNREWFRCELIVSHQSVTGEPDDISIINDLQEKWMKATKKNEELEQLVEKQKFAIMRGKKDELLKVLHVVNERLQQKKGVLTKLEDSLEKLNRIIEINEQSEEEQS